MWCLPNTRTVYKIDAIHAYALPIIWISILVALLIFSNSFRFLPNEFALIISAAFLIPSVIFAYAEIYKETKPGEGQPSSTVSRLLLISCSPFFLAYGLALKFVSFLWLLITTITKKKIMVSELSDNNEPVPVSPSSKQFDKSFTNESRKLRNAKIIPLPPMGNEFDRFYTKQGEILSKVIPNISALITTLALYVPLTLASYFLLSEEGLLINRVTLFGIFMIIFGIINYYSTRPNGKHRFGRDMEEQNRIINPLLKSCLFIGIFLIPAMFVWAGFFQLGLTLTYLVLFAGLAFLSVLAKERIIIKGNLFLRKLQSSPVDFQTYAPGQMVSGSLIMALVVYPLLKWYEISGALKGLTLLPAEILTIATAAFFASFICLLVLIVMARNMSDREYHGEYHGNRDFLARNSLLYLYVFISLTFFGTFIIGITPSSIIVHNYNQTTFNVGIIFASGGILYLGAIEIPYRIGVKGERNKKLQKQKEELEAVEQQLDDAFSKKSYSDFTILFYQRDRLKSDIEELNKTTLSLFKKLPLPAAAAAFLSGILMQIAVPRITEVIQGILGR